MIQGAVFALWVSLIWATRHPMDSWLAQHVPVSLFLRIDPLVMTVVCGGMRMAVTITMLAVVTMVVSLLLGRVFCGWVCPLGTIFDFYGWFLRRLNVPFFGPSPKYYRFKFYLLAAILVFAILGGVSPLMGFDPIVLLTRTAAVVVNPFLRVSDRILFTVENDPGYYGWFVDGATLVLFLGIMTMTTKVSRIWCRTACPLGAYLGILGRNSVLRRDTQGCIHCNICAEHCPTGAINFQDETIYNESECIKCFACSQECPVDANYFTLKSPIPAVSASQHPVSLERRTLFGTVAAAVLATPGLRLAGGEPLKGKELIRPPMSRKERDFLASCIRCTECIKACPTGVLKSAGIEHGFRALWSPIMEPTEGYCHPECHACSEACPTDAIMKYPIEKKYKYKSGTAYLDSSRCVAYAENKYCNECVKACPTEAIPFSLGWQPESGMGADAPAPDGLTSTRPLRVEYDLCIGCGACEYECNKIVFGEPAMIVTGYGRTVPSAVEGPPKNIKPL